MTNPTDPNRPSSEVEASATLDAREREARAWRRHCQCQRDRMLGHAAPDNAVPSRGMAEREMEEATSATSELVRYGRVACEVFEVLRHCDAARRHLVGVTVEDIANVHLRALQRMAEEAEALLDSASDAMTAVEEAERTGEVVPMERAA